MDTPFVEGSGEFTVKIGKELFTYDNWNKIPQTFDALIAWMPSIPLGPHTHEQHEYIESLPHRMKEFLNASRY